jgi:hypothetical protein
MAELTYDPTPADQPEFNEEEQEALKIGEAQHEAEHGLLAGKFRDAEQLEQAYIELQRKFGEPREEVAEPEPVKEEVKEEPPEQKEPVLDSQLSNTEAEELTNMVGGHDKYVEMLQWAGETLSEKEIEMFDTVVATGNKNSCYFAIKALQDRYTDAVGKEAPLVSGRSSAEKSNAFRSQAEVVAAMGDPRYDKDPAYRQDVFNKLERSQLQY